MLAVVIVNWNDTAASIRALRSVRATEPVVTILVDNASPDDPTAAVLAAQPETQMLRLAANEGYAAACNRGVRAAAAAGAEHVLVMNNDAELAPDALDRLAAAAREHPGAVLAPLIVYTDAPDEVWSAGGYLEPPCVRNHHLGLGEPRSAHTAPRAAAHAVEWATGCALFFSMTTFDRVGPFDEKFFLYLEDVDWCLRARRAGIPTWIIPEAVVQHDVSRTTGELPSATIRYYAYRNHFRLAFRHAGWARGAVAGELVWTLAKISVRQLVYPAFRHDEWYHARTRAVRDFLFGRFGPDPVLS
jgi:GT2 family glycosyltransferase